MRSFLIAIAGILFCCDASGQIGDAPFIYEETALSYGTHLTGKLGVNTIYSGDKIFSVVGFFDTHRDPGTPSDFKKGLIATNPQQTLYMTGVCYGKVFYANYSSVRYTLKGGLSIGVLSTPANYEYSNGYFNSNYNFAHQSQLAVGLLINPTIEFPITRHFGFSCGLFSNINIFSPVVGLEVSMLFGKLRDRKS